MKTISEVYGPLLDEFVHELAKYPTSDYIGIPHPFLPEIGRNYRLALKRIAIVGEETRGWPPTLDAFISTYQKNGFNFAEEMAEFQNLDFKDPSWMGGVPILSSFWGFWMNVLAKVYGIEDWGELKRGQFDILLDSFAWGNTNAIETTTSIGVDFSAPGYWRAKRVAERLFDSIDLLVRAVDPHVVILTCSKPEKDRYLGPAFQCVEQVENKVSVYKRDELIVFHMPHPSKQRKYAGGSERYAIIVRELLLKYGMFCPLTNVLTEGLKPEAQEILVRECTGIDKFDAIAKIAAELRRQRSLMTAKSLCLDILNPAGHKTTRGGAFTENSQGPCKLVSAAWKHFQFVRKMPDVAENIALAFTNVHGNYAYEQ